MAAWLAAGLRRSQRSILLAGLILLLTVSGQAGDLKPLPSDQYPRFSDDLDYRELDRALEKSLTALRRLPESTALTLAGRPIAARRLTETLLRFQALLRGRPSPDALDAELRRSFDLYALNRQADGSNSRMLITGYYQPIFAGSPTPAPPFLHPLHRVPEDLVADDAPPGRKARVGRLVSGRLVPYWTRREIEENRLLAGQELLWLKDPFDAFVLHVQGSGLIRFADGSLHGVRYAGTNGREYRSIGKLLVDTGRMPLVRVTMDSIRAYVDAHSDERQAILHHNESYVFFHRCPPGPAIGSLGVELTAGRSLAADRTWYPPGALIFLNSRRPVTDDQGRWTEMRRFATVQDTGSALAGPGRIDLFWGTGERAGQEAGAMKEEGQVYLLLLREKTAPR